MFNNTSFLDIPEILTRNMARRYILIGCGVNVGLKPKGLFDISHCEEWVIDMKKVKKYPETLAGIRDLILVGAPH